MAEKFYCDICEKIFSSGYALAYHLRSKEHRDKLNFGSDSVIEKFIRGIKAEMDKKEIK